MTISQEASPPLSVSELSHHLKSMVENHFSRVQVRGEISGCKHHTSGHIYMALKDDKSVLDGVCWRGNAGRLALKPQDGMDVIVTGRLTTYPGRSKYQIVIEDMTLAGEGALLKLLEDRRRQFAIEGLFDEHLKKPLPRLPRNIALVTSPTGAVIQDILHRLSERCPRPVQLWPVAVQGEGAADQIASALDGFNALPAEFPRPDVIIVARGGGSLEDLWAFNEEEVVRAVARSEIPVISGVGHEPDVTLIDYVADKRAPTPTAAAEMVVPVKADVLGYLDQQQKRLQGNLKRLIQETEQRLDDRTDRFFQAPLLYLERFSQSTHSLAARLRTPQEMLEKAMLQVSNLSGRLVSTGSVRLDLLEKGLSSWANLLESYSYEAVLKRGFTVIQRQKGGYLKRLEDLHRTESVQIIFSDGTCLGTLTPQKPFPEKPRKKKEESTQADLWS